MPPFTGGTKHTNKMNKRHRKKRRKKSNKVAEIREAMWEMMFGKFDKRHAAKLGIKK